MQALRPNGTVLETWLEFLRNPRSQEMLELAKTRPEIAKAQDILLRVNSDPEARELWRMREKAIYDESSALAFAKKEGREEGREEGITIGEAKGKTEGKLEEKFKVAKNLKDMGLALDVIQKATGLNIDEINNA